MKEDILLVEPGDAVRSIVKIYLMNLQTGFLEATDATGGLELLQRNPVSLIIVSLQMRDMDGVAFCARVRANPDDRIRQLPLILLASEKTEALRKRAASAGVTDVVGKPVTSEALVESVKRLLSASLG